LVAVFMLGGIASAIPATLVLFFIQDRLRADAAWQPVFLIVYFVCAALAVPLWLRAVKRWGLAVSWLLGMVLAMAVFAGASPLQAGDNIPFLLICALSGAALGADLALPSALLTGVIAQMGDTGRAEGAYFGWWNFASKLNLALSAGLVLPALAYFGYTPGTQDPQALEALAVAYCAVPCALKTLAAICLYRFWIRQPTFRKPMR
jgi:Na+/melibiose symporter-like transporter